MHVFSIRVENSMDSDQKNSFETDLLSTQNMLKLIDKKKVKLQ